jgi:hypothetical protein
LSEFKNPITQNQSKPKPTPQIAIKRYQTKSEVQGEENPETVEEGVVFCQVKRCMKVQGEENPETVEEAAEARTAPAATRGPTAHGALAPRPAPPHPSLNLL